MYMPGRLRTASRTSRTVIFSEPYYDEEGAVVGVIETGVFSDILWLLFSVRKPVRASSPAGTQTVVCWRGMCSSTRCRPHRKLRKISHFQADLQGLRPS